MTTTTTTAAPVDPLVGKTLGQSESLSNWVGPYVTNMLGQAQAFSQQPYQVYQGPLTAGASPLQQQAMQGIAGLTTPSSISQAATTAGQVAQSAGGLGYTPSTFGNAFTAPAAYSPTQFQTGIFGTQEAQQYMNPFLQSALQPQLKELTRQSDIARMADAARLTGAGAFGGSRQAIMEAEGRRNLLDKQSDVLAQGYKSAYDVAQQAYAQDQARQLEAQRASEASRQFGAQQGMTAAQQAAQYGLAGQQASEASKQFGATYGLDALSKQLQAAQTQAALGQAQFETDQSRLNQLMSAGTLQRGIEQEGITADLQEYLQQRDYPMKMLQFQQSMLQGLPIQSVSNNIQQPSTLSSILGGTSGILSLLQTAGFLPKQ